MTKNNKKEFDCIAMKSNIQKQIYSETKNMTVNELLYYFNGNEPDIQEKIAAAERLDGIASKNPLTLKDIKNKGWRGRVKCKAADTLSRLLQL